MCVFEVSLQGGYAIAYLWRLACWGARLTVPDSVVDVAINWLNDTAPAALAVNVENIVIFKKKTLTLLKVARIFWSLRFSSSYINTLQGTKAPTCDATAPPFPNLNLKQVWVCPIFGNWLRARRQVCRDDPQRIYDDDEGDYPEKYFKKMTQY